MASEWSSGCVARKVVDVDGSAARLVVQPLASRLAGTRRSCRWRRATATKRLATLVAASNSKSPIGCHSCTQRATVATSPRTVRLSTMDIAASDQRASRGQLLTIARPGTKSRNTIASRILGTPTLPSAVSIRRPIATSSARRSSVSARRMVSSEYSRILSDTVSSLPNVAPFVQASAVFGGWKQQVLIDRVRVYRKFMLSGVFGVT